MKTFKIYQIDAFTKERFNGNPAGVVVNADGLTVTQMQQIAKELNNSETAFLFSPEDSDSDGSIRYFTQNQKFQFADMLPSPLCMRKLLNTIWILVF